MTENDDFGNRRVVELAQRDVPLLAESLTVGEALTAIRQHGVGGADRLLLRRRSRPTAAWRGSDPSTVDRSAGCTPERRDGDARNGAGRGHNCNRGVRGIRRSAVPCAPVVDSERRVVGVVDVSVFTDEVFDLAERQEVEDLFETIGFRVSQVRELRLRERSDCVSRGSSRRSRAGQPAP